MARLSHDMTEDEVRDEYEWMVTFMAAMAESIRGTKDVHSLAAYVRKLERENAELRERVKGFLGQRDERLAAAETRCNELCELVRHMGTCIQHLDRTDEDGGCVRCPYQTLEHDCGFEQRMHELGII